MAKKKEKVINKLNVKALAVAVGATWALFVLLIGLSARIFNWGTAFVKLMSTVYIGYNTFPFGCGIGALWGFLDGAIGGAVVAWIYNWVTKKW